MGNNIEQYWSEQERMLAEHLKTKDVNDFLQWTFLQKSMFHELHSAKYNDLRASKYWDKWKDALNEDDFGNPNRYYLYTQSSGNLLHHAHSLWQFAEFLKKFDVFEWNSIFEFGGGYGSVCRLIHRLDFVGNYILYDLPTFLTLQRLYLENVHINMNNIKFLSQLNEEIDVDLFIAMWSISESPIPLREQVLLKVKAKMYLIIFQKMLDPASMFTGIDNSKYFEEFTKRYPNYRWKMYDVPYLPGNCYLFGERND